MGRPCFSLSGEGKTQKNIKKNVFFFQIKFFYSTDDKELKKAFNMRINMFRITDHNLIIVTLGSDYGDTILRTGLPYEVDRIGIDTGNGMSKRGQGGGRR